MNIDIDYLGIEVRIGYTPETQELRFKTGKHQRGKEAAVERNKNRRSSPVVC